MRLLCSYGSGLAGVLLVLSALVGGSRVTVLILPAVLLLVFGEPVAAFIPSLGVVNPGAILLLGGFALGLVTLGWARKRA